MLFHVQPFPFPLADLGAWLSESLPILPDSRELAEQAPDGPLRLIGPFPAFYQDARRFLDEGPRGASRTGWRALATAANQPIALVDITLSNAGSPLYAARGRDAAEAFEQALQLVAENSADGEYQLGWLSLADIYVTTLWLDGNEPLFVPTRLGNSERVQAGMTSLAELKEIVRVLIQNSPTEEARDSSERFFSLRRGLRSSARSGLPEE